jgi:hypothetical protein
MKTREEQQAMVDRLKTTWTAFGGLSKEEQEFLKENQKDTIEYDVYGNGSSFETGDEMYDGMLLRIRPDFQLPKEEPKERWFFNVHSKNITKDTILCDDDIDAGWIEITAEQKAYLETKPKAEAGFEWVLKVHEQGYARWMDFNGDYCGYGVVTDEELNHIRWVRVPVKVESKFVDGVALINGIEVPCLVLDTNARKVHK